MFAPILFLLVASAVFGQSTFNYRRITMPTELAKKFNFTGRPDFKGFTFPAEIAQKYGITGKPNAELLRKAAEEVRNKYHTTLAGK